MITTQDTIGNVKVESFSAVQFDRYDLQELCDGCSTPSIVIQITLALAQTHIVLAKQLMQESPRRMLFSIPIWMSASLDHIQPL